MSCICGTLYNVVFPAFNIVAAIIGKDAFFEPDISIVPSSLLPPFIMYSDIFSLPFPFYFAIYYVIFIDLVIFVKNKS